MHLPKFEYLEPGEISEAVSMMDKYQGQCVIIAGGTDLLVAMKQRRKVPEYVISLANISGLKQIMEEPGTISIGPLATLEEIATSRLIKEKLPLLAQAAWEVGSPLLRTVATIGGNICLNTRCKFYNQSEFWRSAKPDCFKAGGVICHVTNKENTCYSTFSGDVAPALIALNAQIRLSGGGDEGWLPIEQFYTGLGKAPNLLASGKNSVLTEIKIPLPTDGIKGLYRKYRFRESLDFPLVGLAALLKIDSGEEICREARLIFSGVGSGPVRAFAAESKLVGQKFDKDLIAAAAEAAAAEVHPVKTDRVSPQFKKRIVKSMVSEAFAELGGVKS